MSCTMEDHNTEFRSCQCGQLSLGSQSLHSTSLISNINSHPDAPILGTRIVSVTNRAVLALSVEILEDTKGRLRIVCIRAEAPLDLTHALLHLPDDHFLSLLLEAPHLAQRDRIDDAPRTAEEDDTAGRLLEARGLRAVRERDLGPIALDVDSLIGLVANEDETRGGLGLHEAHAGDRHFRGHVVGAWDDVDVAGVDLADGLVLADGLDDHGLGDAVGEVPDCDGAVGVEARWDGGTGDR